MIQMETSQKRNFDNDSAALLAGIVSVHPIDWVANRVSLGPEFRAAKT